MCFVKERLASVAVAWVCLWSYLPRGVLLDYTERKWVNASGLARAILRAISGHITTVLLLSGRFRFSFPVGGVFWDFFAISWFWNCHCLFVSVLFALLPLLKVRNCIAYCATLRPGDLPWFYNFLRSMRCGQLIGGNFSAFNLGILAFTCLSDVKLAFGFNGLCFWYFLLEFSDGGEWISTLILWAVHFFARFLLHYLKGTIHYTTATGGHLYRPISNGFTIASCVKN